MVALDYLLAQARTPIKEVCMMCKDTGLWYADVVSLECKILTVSLKAIYAKYVSPVIILGSLSLLYLTVIPEPAVWQDTEMGW